MALIQRQTSEVEMILNALKKKHGELRLKAADKEAVRTHRGGQARSASALRGLLRGRRKPLRRRA